MKVGYDAQPSDENDLVARRNEMARPRAAAAVHDAGSQSRLLVVDATKLRMNALKFRLPLLNAAAPRTRAREMTNGINGRSAKINWRIKDFGDG